MADNAVLFKLLAKSVGMKYGIMPTFMAKPYGDVSGIAAEVNSVMADISASCFSDFDHELAPWNFRSYPRIDS